MRAYSDPEPPIRRNQPYRNLPAHSAGVADRERRPEPYGPTDRPGKRNRPDRRARPDRPGRPGRHRRPTRTDRASLLWGYLPLVLASLLITALIAVFPSVRPDADTVAGPAGPENPAGQTASGWGDTVSPCEERADQIDGDGYSPPCFTFADGADNGGATSPGVTADTIKIGYRMSPDPHILTVLAQIGSIPFEATNEDMVRTAEGLVDYFNQHFQFYGRKMVLERYTGRGSVLSELQAGGQETATSDAVTAAKDVGAFADITGWTQPFADALARNRVISVGAPYMSREWFVAHRPYVWSNYPDCTITTEAATNYNIQRLAGKPATYAGGDLQGRERKLALVMPNNTEYRQCADAGDRILSGAGLTVDLRLEYLLDTAQLQSQASSILAKLKAEHITSVAMATDPILAVYLVEQARQQNYRPEWLLLGTGFTDLDLVGQVIAESSGGAWDSAFGTSTSAAPVPWGESDAYKAFKSVRPDEEPSTLVDLIYNQIYLVALGIQMAGPELTPDNFEAGMFSYPGGSGQFGHWDFDSEHYAGTTDVREMWWDPDAVSPFNGRPGSYVDHGDRWDINDIPEGDPQVFE
jgi:hypothetical protein